MSFRKPEKIPKRRPIETEVSHYSQHRDDLIIDFKGRCGYCNDFHTYRVSSFEIDHFIPRKKNKQQFLTIKTETDYSNLVYSCKSCNNAKSNKWPTNNQRVSHENDEGFIDPCDCSYDDQFERLTNGQIRPITNLGKWIYKELKLAKPQHEIIHNIEELDLVIDDLEKELDKLKESEDENIEVYKKISMLMLRYRSYIKKLGDL